jgi:hypothetical protein
VHTGTNPAATAVHEFGHILELDTIGSSPAPRSDLRTNSAGARLQEQAFLGSAGENFPFCLIRYQS